MKKLLFLLIILLFCSNQLINHKTNNSGHNKSILIGDSNVNVLSKTKGFSSLGVDIGPYKSGLTTIGLIDLIGKSNIDTIHTIIFIEIGTNENNYQSNNSESLHKVIRKVYPKSSELYVIWGTRGWGRNKETSIVDQDLFYNRFEFHRFKVIRVTSGYFKTDTLAHTPNQKYQLEVIDRIKKIVN